MDFGVVRAGRPKPRENLKSFSQNQIGRNQKMREPI
jgi:hypothetical protein